MIPPKTYRSNTVHLRNLRNYLEDVGLGLINFRLGYHKKDNKEDNVVTTQIFDMFHPNLWGRWTHFDEDIFQMGWFEPPTRPALKLQGLVQPPN